MSAVVLSSCHGTHLWCGLALLVAACARPLELDPPVIDQIGGAAAAQVKRCYRSPRVASSGKQITTRLLVRFRADGGLAGMPMLLSQSGVTPANRPYAAKMAQAAGQAVMRCAPLRLPYHLYNRGWDELILTFSPSARA